MPLQQHDAKLKVKDAAVMEVAIPNVSDSIEKNCFKICLKEIIGY